MLDIYVGFMDEEVSSVLTHLVDHAVHANRPVVVIERGRPEGMLFERHARSYGTLSGRFLSNVVYGGQMEGREEAFSLGLERCLNLKFNQELLGTLEAASDPSEGVKFKTREIVLGRPGDTGSPRPLFSVLRFVPDSSGTAPANGDPIVVIRSPEMGFQPNLVGSFLRAVFGAVLKTLGAEKKEEKKFRVSIYGAGGAIDVGDMPGTVHDIRGSVYVGSEIEPNTTPRKFRGVVSFLGLKHGSSRQFTRYDLYQSRAYTEDKARQKAENDAKAAFAFLCGVPDGNETWRSKAKLDTTKTAAALREQFREVDGKNVSLTTSFFTDTQIKSLARKLGLHDVNMEDFHMLEVLELLHSKPEEFGNAELDRFKLIRVDCDPPEISPKVKELFGGWLHNTKYTRQTYLAALRWGLHGAQVDHLTDVARSPRDRPFHWSLFDQKEVPSGWEELFFPLKDADGGPRHVLDPFFVEIATDFLSSVRDKNLYGDSDPESADHRFKKDADEKKDVAHRLSRQAERLLKVFALLQSGQPAGFLNGDLEDLLAAIFTHENYVNGHCPLIAARSEYEIWARPGSWDPENKDLVLASGLKPSGPIVDRALYKSANQAALQEHAKQILDWGA
jgi:hypothetical protein